MPVRTPARTARRPTTSDRRALTQRAIDFEIDCTVAACDHSEEVPLGLWIRSASHPKMWMLNQLHVRGPQPDLTADDLVAELDRGLADVGHRRAQVGDDATGRRLADDVAKLEGWTAAPVLVMVLEREPPEPPPGVTREIDHEAMMALEALLVDEYDDVPQDEKPVVVAGRAHLTAVIDGTRYFTATADGTDVSTVYLYTDGRTGQLEDVGTLEAHRGQGLASATVNVAARAAIDAGCDMTFLVCHAGTGPVALYADLGFRTVGRYWAFTRRG